MPIDVMLVGLGGIGYKYDKDVADRSFVYSHAKALLSDPRFELVSAVDIDDEILSEFNYKCNVPVFSSLDAALNRNKKVDVVIVATPTHTHYEVIDKIVGANLCDIILLEKPIATNLVDAQKIVKLCKDKNIQLFVNYVRRSDVGVLEIAKILKSWRAKKVKAVCWYSKGWLHNGSHFFNLLEYWLGNKVESDKLNSRTKNGYEDIDAFVKFEHGDVFFISAWEESYSFYEIQLISPYGKISYLKGGEQILIQKPEKDENFDGYNVLGAELSVENTMHRYQAEVYNELYNFINDKHWFLCTGESALKTMQSMEFY